MTSVTPPIEPGPPTVDLERVRQNLKLLSIFYYIYAGLQALGLCGGLFYGGMGLAMLMSPEASTDSDMRVMSWVFIGFGGCFCLFAPVMAWLIYRAGRSLTQYRRRTYIQVIAVIIAVLGIPLGTVLGVFTFVVLSSDGAKQLFASQESMWPGAPERYPT